MQIPYWLLKLLPLFEYICPKCRREVEKASHKCIYCGEPYGVPLRIPPKVLKSKKALEEYVHTQVFPRVSAFERNYLTKYFTVLFADGFESENDLFNTNWGGKTTSGGGTLVIGSVTHHGSQSALATATNAQTAYCTKIWTPDVTEAYQRIYFRVDVKPSNNNIVNFLRMRGDGNTIAILSIKTLSGVDSLRFSYYYPALNSTDTAWSYNVNTWYCFELGALMGSAANGFYKVWADGVLIFNFTGLDTSGRADIDCIDVGIIYTDSTNTHNVRIDCVAVADAYIGQEVAPFITHVRYI